MASEPLGQLPQPSVFWHLDSYPTRAAAEAAKGPRGTVVEALGQVWLFTIGEGSWRPPGGVRVAEIGPLPVKAGEQYTAQYYGGHLQAGRCDPEASPSGTRGVVYDGWGLLRGDPGRQDGGTRRPGHRHSD